MDKLPEFTPMIDSILQDTSPTIAIVYGRIWRYCQMSDHCCRAAVGTIAKEVLLGEKTVRRSIKVLVEKEYIVDTTPNLRNRPHTFYLTGKGLLGHYDQSAWSPCPPDVVTMTNEESIREILIERDCQNSTSASKQNQNQGQVQKRSSNGKPSAELLAEKFVFPRENMSYLQICLDNGLEPLSESDASEWNLAFQDYLSQGFTNSDVAGTFDSLRQQNSLVDAYHHPEDIMTVTNPHQLLPFIISYCGKQCLGRSQ